MTARYRIQQGIRALLAFSRQPDYALATPYLNTRQMALFQCLSRGEQLHSLNVLRDVLAQETHTPPGLAQAALLHDVGKTRYPTDVLQKTLAVLVRALAPRRYAQWSQGDPRSYWRRGLAVHEQHPAWSAQLAAEADAPETALWLIAHHADPPTHWDHHPNGHLLRRLQRADDAN
jgi:hypothetical protein